MKGFNKDYILEKLADTEDLENASSDIFALNGIPESEEVPEELKGLLNYVGKAVGMDYIDLGEDSYDAYGLYYFLPDAEEDPCRYFSAVITISENVNQIGITDLYQIINRINGRITEGTFLLSQDETTLFYRCNTPVPIDTEDETALHIVGLRMLNAIATVAAWIDVLMGLNDGNRTYEECLESTKNSEEV